ncbi:hypothetical protein F511_26204 [Dorcoceras hygrometricum]|uniref:Uncharacterized protein n=1 Tax=Dorcoceras hygrometricum TaxID=472368 RepID=A0A2Z7AX57_9LAMI|nr:hypothetical protein F511_26204 [Dorcoceras hygrometricum]
MMMSPMTSSALIHLLILHTTSLPLASGCKLPADSCDWMTSPMTSSTTNPSAESQHDVASALRFAPSADCDDIKADVITAQSKSSASADLHHLLDYYAPAGSTLAIA